MDADAEGEVVGRVAVQVEGVRVFVMARVTVRRGEQEQDSCAGRDRVLTHGVVAGGGAVEPLNRCDEPKLFLDCPGNQVGVLAQLGVQFGSFREGQEQPRQEVHRRLAAGTDEHGSAPEDLIVGQHIVAIRSCHHRDEVITGVTATLGDEVVEVASHRRRRTG